jgi:hypothetical protein
MQRGQRRKEENTMTQNANPIAQEARDTVPTTHEVKDAISNTQDINEVVPTTQDIDDATLQQANGGFLAGALFGAKLYTRIKSALRG